MCVKARSSSQHNSTMNTRLSAEGWYGPEVLNKLQELYDALWSKLEKDVYPWDAEATRERLAVLVFELDRAMTRSSPRFGPTGKTNLTELTRMAVAINTFSAAKLSGGRQSSPFRTIVAPISAEWPIAF
jgi:hypothetical protein